MHRRDFIFGRATLLISGNRLDDAIALIDDATTAGWFAAEASISAAALKVTHGSFVLARGFGKAKEANTVFLLSSLSKPMVAAGIMILCDR